MRQKHLDLLLIVAIAAMNVIWALLPDHLPLIGIIFALPLVFVLPGYTLTGILFHSRSLDAVHRFLLSLGLSLAIDILAGFILNVFPIGLREISWAVFLGLLTTMFSLWIAYLRWKKAGSNGVSNRFRLRLHEFVLLGLALVVVILAVQYSAINVIQEPHPGFTQLWVLPSMEHGDSCTIRLGVRSFESTPVTFRVVMTSNESQVSAWSSITLAPQKEWDQAVSLRPGASDSMYIEVQLDRVDEPGIVYRDVHLTLHSSKRSKNGQGQQCTT